MIKTEKVSSGHEWKINLPEGNYTATASLDGIPDIKSLNFTVKIYKDPVLIDAEDITVIYNTESYLNVTLKNGVDQSPISNTQISVDIDGDVSNYTSNNNGIISIPLKYLDICMHTASISISGNEIYEDTAKTVSISIWRVPAKIECENPFTIKYNIGNDFSIRVSDENSNPLRNVEFVIDLLEGISFRTNGVGHAIVDSTIFQKLAAGNYTTTIRFVEDTVYGPSKTINIIIEKQNTTISSNDIITTVHSDDKIVASLTNEQGNPVSGVELTIDLLPGETFTTDENGQIEISIKDLTVGEYEAEISFAGDENYTASSNIVHITINKESTQLFADNITTPANIAKDFTISLKDSKNNPIPNAKISIVIDDIEEKTSDENGQVTLSTEGMKAGKYNVVIFFDGNENYTESSAKAKIEITAVDTVISITAVDVSYGENATINFTLKDIEGNNINGELSVSIGEINKTVPVENGFGSTKVPVLNVGTYTVIANYAGNKNYTASYAISKFNAAKLGTQIIYEDMNTKAVSPLDPKTGEWFKWKLLDSNGKPMTNIPMQIGFNGVVYDEKNGILTDDNANAKLQII